MALTLEIANKMNEINDGYGDVRKSYSGRGMNGRTTVGYTDSDSSMSELVDLYVDACEELGVERDIRCLQFDSMGNGTIVY